MDHNDIILQSIYGAGYGKADKSGEQAAESERSAADPSRRATGEDVNADSGWYKPSASIFGVELDRELGVKPGAAGLMPVDEDWRDHVDAEPVAADVDPLASIVETEMSDGWTDTVAAYARSHDAFTADEVLTGAFGMVAEFIDKADQMRVAEILRGLGYVKDRVTRDGERVVTWRAATPVATPLSAD